MMRAGFGMWELTPPMGVELAGYGYYLGRRAESVRDPLYARAVIIETEEEKSLLISCDVLGLSRTVCDAVIAHAASLGFAPRQVIMVRDFRPVCSKIFVIMEGPAVCLRCENEPVMRPVPESQ